MVIDKDQQLLGTVTDGDIRRAIIRNCSMDTPVSEVMNHQPAVATTRDSQETIRRVMAKKFVTRVPLVNDEGVIIGLLSDDAVCPNVSYDSSVLLMAGGFGRRLYPLTESTPKPLLKVAEKPILEAIVEQ